LRADYDEIKKRNAEVVCVVDGDSAEEAKKLKEELKLEFPIAIDTPRKTVKLYAPEAAEPKGFPWLLVVDKGGRIRLSHVSLAGPASRDSILRALDEVK